MGSRSFSHWFKLGLEMNVLALEAQQVIAMRMMRLSVGGAKSAREARRMMSEKVLAAGEAGLKLATGGSGHSIVKHYRRKVSANRRRLAK